MEVKLDHNSKLVIILNKPIILLGGGGHASVLIEILILTNSTILGIVDPQLQKGILINGIPVLGNDDIVLDYSKQEVRLVNGLGPKVKSSSREQLSNKFINLGYEFSTLIHPNAYVSKSSTIEEGSQIMAGAIIQTKALVGKLSVINSGAIIEHDCRIGEHNHIAPGAVLCGGVCTESGVFIGSGAVVLENLRIKSHSTIAAGSTLRKNLTNKEIFYGH